MALARNKVDSGKPARRYMLELIGEHLTGKPSSIIQVHAMRWGHQWEPVARDLYQQQTGLAVEQVGFVAHGNEQWIGCSPDGLVGGDGITEHKCPEVAAFHLDVIMSGAMPDEHWPQVQFNQWVCGKQWCDFVSFHPDFPPRWREVVIRVPRDDEYIDTLRTRVLEFRDEMLRRLNLIVERWE